ncbi:MAG: hypothetical protein WD887_00125 [Candidatus Saccharimonadales bacterium]
MSEPLMPADPAEDYLTYANVMGHDPEVRDAIACYLRNKGTEPIESEGDNYAA